MRSILPRESTESYSRCAGERERTVQAVTGAHLSTRVGPGLRGMLAGFIGGAGIVLILGGAWWLLFGARLPEATPNLSAEQRRGEAIYNANCVSCHGGRTGGGMMDYPPRHNANGHTWHHPDCELTAIVREGSNEMMDAMREMMAPPDAPNMRAFRDRLS